MKFNEPPIKLPELAETRSDTAQSQSYQRLRHALMVGAIRPGIAITIQEIADSLNVSATPAREALRQLCSENALLALKNRRIKVPEMTNVRFLELMSLRCVLEGYAAKCALPYINSVQIDHLEQIDFQLDEVITDNNWEATVVLNQEFHSRLFQANPNQVVIPMIESIWLQLGPFMRIAAQFQKEIYLVDRHKEIIEALRLNDSDKLEIAIQADIREGIDQLKPEMLASIIREQEI